MSCFARVLALICICLCAGNARANGSAPDELRAKLQDLAERVLETTDRQPVDVGEFTDNGLGQTNFGPGLKALLQESLVRIAGKEVVSGDAKFIVKGDYAFAQVREREDLKGLNVIQVRVRILDRQFNETIDEAPFATPLNAEAIGLLEQNASIAEVLQVSGQVDPLPLEGDLASHRRKQNRQLEALLRVPQVHIDGPDRSRASSSEFSPNAVEIRVNGKALPLRLVDGQAFVDLEEDDVYEIHLYNEDIEKLSAGITVDGLSVFHFAEPEFRDRRGAPVVRRWIVPASTHTGQPGTLAVKGWFARLKPPRNFYEFTVTGYGRGAASQMGVSEGEVGVIHVQFARPARNPLPKGFRGALPTGPRLETARGRRIDVAVEASTQKFEEPTDFVAIRYSR